MYLFSSLFVGLWTIQAIFTHCTGTSHGDTEARSLEILHARIVAMVFLLEYDRHAGRLIALTEFTDSDRRMADDARLTRERELNKARIDREVVLLEARDLDAAKRTHKRYFADLNELIADLEATISNYSRR